MSDTSSMAAAIADAQDAKAAYRDEPSAETKAAHRAAAGELRYQRWLARGGPGIEVARIEAQQRKYESLRAAGFETDPPRVNGEVAAMYARWLDENPEG